MKIIEQDFEKTNWADEYYFGLEINGKNVEVNYYVSKDEEIFEILNDIKLTEEENDKIEEYIKNHNLKEKKKKN